jgi:hypothetical protein
MQQRNKHRTPIISFPVFITTRDSRAGGPLAIPTRDSREDHGNVYCVNIMFPARFPSLDQSLMIRLKKLVKV